MSNLTARAAKRLHYTIRSFRADCHYSPALACYRLGDELGGRLGFDSLSWRCNQKKHQWILRYLEKELNPILESYRKDDQLGEYCMNAPIWVCWWDGEETAPPLVQQCIKSIRKNAGDHPVHMITKDNYTEFLTIPEYILKKVEEGYMCLAHLADYIRIALLYQYGGLWLDTTIFCIATIPEVYFDYPVFSFKGKRQESKYVTEFQWACFCLGAWRGSAMFAFLKTAMEQYWASEPSAIDYLFFDYLIKLGLEQVPGAKSYFDVPINNTHRDDLQAAMNEALPADCFDTVIREDTILYKLSWREQYALTTADGKDSIYRYFLNLDL